MCCLPTVPLCPQGRRRWKAHCARGRAPALTLTLPAPPFPEAAQWLSLPSLEPTRADPHPLLLLLWGIWVQPRVGGLFSPPPTQDPSPWPSGTASSCKKNLCSLPDKPCPVCCLACPTCALPSSLYLSPWVAS
uniref:Uncharacterized protein n=1 Tax=Myotis myotis TaxID=51298 RepID=A0A7J7VIV4_MYOMY|nr:hypothetical protein mMyoMyo1_008387 [Myotis myotis]